MATSGFGYYFLTSTYMELNLLITSLTLLLSVIGMAFRYFFSTYSAIQTQILKQINGYEIGKIND